ncbi:Hypothetical predicted protein, partial [Pelobates cultripes]
PRKNHKTPQIQAMIAAAVAASMEKAFAKSFQSEQDAPKPQDSMATTMDNPQE